MGRIMAIGDIHGCRRHRLPSDSETEKARFEKRFQNTVCREHVVADSNRKVAGRPSDFRASNPHLRWGSGRGTGSPRVFAGTNIC